MAAPAIFWRAYPPNPNYIVSEDGQVYSLPRTVRYQGRWGPSGHTVRGRFLAPYDAGTSLQVGVYGRRPNVDNLGRVVLEAFVGPPPPGTECRHLNGDYRDNRVQNLAWGTHTENMQDCIRHGRTLAGTGMPREEKQRRNRERIYALYRRRRAAGQCQQCGEPAARGRGGKLLTMCRKHLDARNAKDRAKRARRG